VITSKDGRRFVILRTSAGLKLAEVIGTSMETRESFFMGRRWRANSQRWTGRQKIAKGLIETLEPNNRNARWLAERLAEIGAVAISSGDYHATDAPGGPLYCETPRTPDHVAILGPFETPFNIEAIDCSDCKRVAVSRLHRFHSGAAVYIDGRDCARVREAFPEGSTSYAFPHYRVDIYDGDSNMAVRWDRVGIDKRGRS
jgi:hypothetical protein